MHHSRSLSNNVITHSYYCCCSPHSEAKALAAATFAETSAGLSFTVRNYVTKILADAGVSSGASAGGAGAGAGASSTA